MAFVSRVLGSGRDSRFARAFALPVTMTSKVAVPAASHQNYGWKGVETPFRIPRLAELCHQSTRSRFLAWKYL